MSEELERHKAALDVAFKALNLVATATDVSLTAVNACAEKALARIAEIFPPEFEEVEVVRWMMKDSGDIHLMPQYHIDNYVKLTGTVKRPVKRPVVKTCLITLTEDGWMSRGAPLESRGLPLEGIFSWQE